MATRRFDRRVWRGSVFSFHVIFVVLVFIFVVVIVVGVVAVPRCGVLLLLLLFVVVVVVVVVCWWFMLSSPPSSGIAMPQAWVGVPGVWLERGSWAGGWGLGMAGAVAGTCASSQHPVQEGTPHFPVHVWVGGCRHFDTVMPRECCNGIK